MRRKKILLLAYACHPTNGSEPFLGWNAVQQLSRFFSVTCLVTGNVEGQRAALEKITIPNVQFEFAELPQFLEKRIDTNSHDIRYYLTQYFWRKTVKALHKKHSFDAAIHATYGRYWMPSALAEIDIPKIFGPVGGGEKCPSGLLKNYAFKNQLSEVLRYVIPEVIRFDPFFNYNKDTWDYALGTTHESSKELRKLGFTNVLTRENIGLDLSEFSRLPPKPSRSEVKFVSIARFIYWKGIQYALKAMAKMDPAGWSYDIAGDGPYVEELKKIAAEHKMTNVNFIGRIPRAKAMQMVNEADALIHPSLHDSGSFIVQEAMAMNTFAIYLQCGGPHHLCSGKFGYGVRVENQTALLNDLRSILEKIVAAPDHFRKASKHGSEIVATHYTWDRYGTDMKDLIDRAIEKRKPSNLII
ncbi:glycosyltransferase [Puniceicoccaceae bacterium K14]|nr:glycosyltransferase [Puniceicoccaceae bacterium K14]